MVGALVTPFLTDHVGRTIDIIPKKIKNNLHMWSVFVERDTVSEVKCAVMAAKRLFEGVVNGVCGQNHDALSF